jgi:transcriptional regulator with XRE-family HTH domain
LKNKIDYWRKKQGMTYQGIAELAGTSPQYVSMLARGKRENPGLLMMQKVAAAFGKNIGQVFEMKEAGI